MASKKYCEYFDVNESYFPCIDESAINAGAPWETTYPHETFIDLLNSAEKMLGGTTNRSIWIHGAYGTGKSQCAYALKKILEVPNDELRAYWDRYEPLKKNKALLEKLIGHKEQGVLTAYRYASGSITSPQLLFLAVQESIRAALDAVPGSYKGENTLKESVIAWLTDSSHNAFVNSLLQKPEWVSEFSQSSADEIINSLRKRSDVSSLMESIFKMAEKEGITALSLTADSLCAWIKDIVAQNHTKVVLIWDEFSGFFRQNRNSLDEFQKIVALCQETHFYFVIVTHPITSIAGASISKDDPMRDWLLKKFEDENGNFDKDDMVRFVKKYIPRKDDWTSIKNRVIVEGERVKFLAKISIDIDVKTGQVSFALPDFGLGYKDTIVEGDVWAECKDDLVRGNDVWGMIELGYRSPEDFDIEFEYESKRSRGKTSRDGRIRLISFKNFCPYQIDLDQYKDARREFSTDEWIDIILGAVDYNANGYETEEQKLTMLTRLLPFVEKRLNLIELAPKGTGKSYLFGNVSRFGWLSSGGVMSRAKMFYDQTKRKEGLIAGNDFVTLDEVQTISFTDTDEMRAALKGYLEQGNFTVGDYKGVADAGVILCGNIRKEIMDADGYSNMFTELPVVFHESALIERFHGFIKGWNIPRMNDDLKVDGWALNSEYFCSIMHELRSDMTYRTIVDELIIVPEGADTRDTEAVKRISTAYLKLLFPNVQKVSDIEPREFKRYCLDRARKMRDTIKYQLGLLDVEYSGKDLPAFSVKGLE